MGVVEASSDNISIGVPLNRIVEKVAVHVGEEVKKGEILFTLENHDLQSELAGGKILLEIAKAKYKKMKELPREEDLSAAEATLKSAQVEEQQAASQYQMVQALRDSRALSQEEVNRRKFNYEQAEAHLQEAQAQLDKIKSGAWKPDLAIAALEIKQAQVGIERIEADIERTIIRSPLDGKVLQINIHEGESPAGKSDLMLVGNTEEIYLKVSVNQLDASAFRPTANAVAFLRGDPKTQFRLEFVRLLPFLINKQNFNNQITDKTDTRVLQIIYRIQTSDHLIFIGQQMDVFIEAEFPS